MINQVIIPILFLLANVVSTVVIVRFILGLLVAFNVVDYHNQVVSSLIHGLDSILDPMLRPIQRHMPDTGGIDFSGLGFRLGEGDYAATFAYGKFITAVIRFLIIAWVVFLLVKLVNRVKQAAIGASRPAEGAPSVPSETELLIEIRDAIRAQKAG